MVKRKKEEIEKKIEMVAEEDMVDNEEEESSNGGSDSISDAGKELAKRAAEESDRDSDDSEYFEPKRVDDRKKRKAERARVSKKEKPRAPEEPEEPEGLEHAEVVAAAQPKADAIVDEVDEVGKIEFPETQSNASKVNEFLKRHPQATEESWCHRFVANKILSHYGHERDQLGGRGPQDTNISFFGPPFKHPNCNDCRVSGTAGLGMYHFYPELPKPAAFLKQEVFTYNLTADFKFIIVLSDSTIVYGMKDHARIHESEIAFEAYKLDLQKRFGLAAAYKDPNEEPGFLLAFIELFSSLMCSQCISKVFSVEEMVSLFVRMCTKMPSEDMMSELLAHVRSKGPGDAGWIDENFLIAKSVCDLKKKLENKEKLKVKMEEEEKRRKKEAKPEAPEAVVKPEAVATRILPKRKAAEKKPEGDPLERKRLAEEKAELKRQAEAEKHEKELSEQQNKVLKKLGLPPFPKKEDPIEEDAVEEDDAEDKTAEEQIEPGEQNGTTTSETSPLPPQRSEKRGTKHPHRSGSESPAGDAQKSPLSKKTKATSPTGSLPDSPVAPRHRSRSRSVAPVNKQRLQDDVSKKASSSAMSASPPRGMLRSSPVAPRGRSRSKSVVPDNKQHESKKGDDAKKKLDLAKENAAKKKANENICSVI